LSLGSASTGALVGNSNQPVLGARPVWLGPLKDDQVFHPEAACSSQAAPNMSSRASEAEAKRAVAGYHLVGRSTSTPDAGQKFKELLRDPTKLQAVLKGAGG